MAIRRPETVRELLEIPGIGITTVEKYARVNSRERNSLCPGRNDDRDCRDPKSASNIRDCDRT